MAQRTGNHTTPSESQAGQRDKTSSEPGAARPVSRTKKAHGAPARAANPASKHKPEEVKSLPHSPDAECNALGAILVDAQGWQHITDTLRPEDFFVSQYRTIFRQIVKLVEAGKTPVDLVTLTEALKQDSQIEEVGGAAFVAKLSDGMPRITSVRAWVSMIKGKSEQRHLIHLAERIQQEAWESDADPRAVATRASEEFRRVHDRIPRPGLLNVSAESGAALLDAAKEFIQRYVKMSEPEAVVIAVWMMHTHAIAAADCTPYLSITSPEKQAGKTRLLEILALLVATPWLTGRATAAVLVRKIDAEKPTLLLDESDTAFSGDEEYSATLRGVLNTGYRRSGTYSCCEGKGSEIQYRDFATFCPKAIAGIGQLPDTVADRAIPIRLKRRLKTEPVEWFIQREAEPQAAEIRNSLHDWGESNTERLQRARPSFPECLSDRQRETAEPLLAIADACRGTWPDDLRRALIEVFTGASAASDSAGVALLRDLQALFTDRKVDYLTSLEICEGLTADEASRWKEWRHDKPITPHALARLLHQFAIAPRKDRSGNKTLRGYARADFGDAWQRYTGAETPSEAHTPLLEVEHPPRD